jgi:flagellar M-ring protein FliF
MLKYFKHATPLAQIFYVLLSSVLIGVAIWAVWFYALRTPWTVLYGDLRAPEAATIIADLDKRKIPYRLSDGGGTIEVPADRADAIRVETEGNDLPLRGTTGFELFNKSDMGLTDFAQKINYQRALQGELARTIMGFDDVENARVHLALGEDRLFREDRITPKASVAVRMKAGQALSATVTSGIQRLIAAAVPQLEASDVVVIDETGTVTSVLLSPKIPHSPMIGAKQAIEAYYKARIEEAIDADWPGQQLGVAVRAELTDLATEPNGSDTVTHSWDIRARNFRLDVTLDPSRFSDVVPHDDLRAVVSTAIDGSGSRGDSVHFGPLPVEVAGDMPSSGMRNSVDEYPVTARSTGVPQIAPPEAFPRAGQSMLSIIMAGLGVIFIGLLARKWWRGHERLSPDEQRSFAQQLEHALERGEAENA